MEMTVSSIWHRTLAPPSRRLLDAFRIVLIAPSHVGNIGSAARAMRTMGLRDLVVVAPRDPAFGLHPQARALAGGGTPVLDAARVTATLAEAVSDCQRVIAVSAEPREFGPLPRLPADAASAAAELVAAGRADRIAFVFGTERTGLSIGDMGQCQWLVTIPADPDYSSLNLAQAVQIIAFSLRQTVLEAAGGFSADDAAHAYPRDPLADHAALERLFAHLEQALIAVGHLDPDAPKRMMPRLRRLIGRAAPDRADVDLLRGLCSRIERLAGARP